MNKRLEYSSLIKKLISCESREQLSDVIKEINEFNKEYSITSRSEEFKKFEIVIGVMRVKLKRKHDIIENQLRSQKQNNKTNMKIVITESQYKILEMNTSVKRRLKGVQIFLDNLMETMYPCDYDDEYSFMSGVISEAKTYFDDVDDFQGMDKSDFLETLETHFEEIKPFLNSKINSFLIVLIGTGTEIPSEFKCKSILQIWFILSKSFELQCFSI